MAAPVLVLGGTGFIGGAVVRALLARGERVRVLSRASSPRDALRGLDVEWATGDLRDAASVKRAAEGCRAIVHAAGHYPTTALRPRETLQRGVQEMRHVLDAARAANARVVYVSSLSTIGLARGGRPADERDVYVPGSVDDPYFEVKYAMEREALAAAATGLEVVVVNPSIVLGPGDVKPTSGRLVLAIARERLPVAIDAPINIVDVRDAAEAIVAAIPRGRSGERYVLAGENLTMRELWRRIAHGSGVRSPIMVPVGVARRFSLATEYVAYAGDVASRPLRRVAPGLARRIRRPPFVPLEGVSILANGQPLDATKARAELGLEARPLDETLRDTLQWFRDNGYAL